MSNGGVLHDQWTTLQESYKNVEGLKLKKSRQLCFRCDGNGHLLFERASESYLSAPCPCPLTNPLTGDYRKSDTVGDQAEDLVSVA